ncbi:MAG: hypothetical protein R3181_01355 [Rubricoccaceae bacterium]|nr:hypothetical protein [Rubricoccaceae bacterium]
MASFIAAVHTRDGQPTALALVEQFPGTPARYAVRRLHPLDGDDARQHVLNDLSDDREVVGHVTLVVTGGQAAADRFHDAGPSAIPVTLTGPGTPADADAISVPPQVLVDTFERVFRDGDVEIPGAFEHASRAVDALYTAADLDAAAPDRDDDEPTTEAMSGDVYAERADTATTVEQSGSEANVSTGIVGDTRTSRAVEMLARGIERTPRGRIAAATGAEVDLGEHEDVALALALATWYGEYAADELPVTDQADEIKR